MADGIIGAKIKKKNEWNFRQKLKKWSKTTFEEIVEACNFISTIKNYQWNFRIEEKTFSSSKTFLTDKLRNDFLRNSYTNPQSKFLRMLRTMFQDFCFCSHVFIKNSCLNATLTHESSFKCNDFFSTNNRVWNSAFIEFKIAIFSIVPMVLFKILCPGNNIYIAIKITWKNVKLNSITSTRISFKQACWIRLYRGDNDACQGHNFNQNNT